ncbi:hypothetical protein [Amycolatopsis sp. NPDC051102]|uniref:hypothetical protein n=1 Tax=Amycolatopsis sp. NPDC051102 TaxID=3155163 RepID=UPI0034284368
MTDDRVPGLPAIRAEIVECPRCGISILADRRGDPELCVICIANLGLMPPATPACAMSWRLTSWAVALLPRGERDGYADEFRANLQVMAGRGDGRWAQVRLALSTLRGVWRLRRASKKPGSLTWWRYY